VLGTVARLAKSRRRRPGYGDTKQRLGRHSLVMSGFNRTLNVKKKASSTGWAEEARKNSSLVAGSGQGDSLFWSAPIPPRGRKRGRPGEPECRNVRGHSTKHGSKRRYQRRFCSVKRIPISP
jgi:hypothetical protein